MGLRTSYKSAAIILGFVLLFAVMTYIIHEAFTVRFTGANDFYPRWKGAQLFWLEGVDPYSRAATEAIQMGMAGRLSSPGEDQFLFVYPFYTLFLLIPLVGAPFTWVNAIWLVTLLFALVAGVLLTLRLVNWRVPVWLWGLTMLWTAVFYHSARTIILGQFAGLVFLWMAGSLLALKKERDVLAGLLLALTTIKPQMSFLLIPALLVWGLGRRRWRFVGSFVGVMAVLASLSFILLPGWLASFIEQVTSYPGYTAIGGPVWIITRFYWPQLGRPVELGLYVLLMAYLFYEWRRLPRVTAASDHFLFLIGVTMLITNLIVKRTATTNYVMLYIPLFWSLKMAVGRRPWRNWLVAAFYLASGVSMWALFLTTISGDYENPVMYLPLPALLVVMLGWGKGRMKDEGGRACPELAEGMKDEG